MQQQCFDEQRKNMVQGQLLPQGVRHVSLLEAMRTLDREEFLPPHLSDVAYTDGPLSVGNGRYMLAPAVLAQMIEALGIEPTDTVLDIGCGTGYSSAILACMADTVVGLEQDKAMAMTGVHQLDQLGLTNAMIIHLGDWTQGYAKKSPYDAILINGAVNHIPEKICAQLADGGRLVAVVARGTRTGTAMLVTRRGNSFATRGLFDTATPVLTGFQNKIGFSF